MIVTESQRSRRLLGRLDRGTDLLPALVSLCQGRGVRGGRLSATGVVDEAELGGPDARGPDARATERPASIRLSGPLSIVHLGGHLSEMNGALHLEATCALAHASPGGGAAVMGGRLVRARVLAVEFVIDCFEDVVVRSAIDLVTGRPHWTEVRPTSSGNQQREAPRFEAGASGRVVPNQGGQGRTVAPQERPVQGQPGQPTWGEVAAASAEKGAVPALPEESGDDDEPLRAGDVIEHPKFGRCTVERIEGIGDYAQVRLRNRRVVRLSLEVLQLQREGRDETGERLFRALMVT